MAGRGPMPATHRQRERDNRRRASNLVRVVDDGVARGPEFPRDVIPDPHPATVAWWDTWRTSPQAQLFAATDWQTLKRAARLQDDVMSSAKVSAAAISELRLIEERLGATYADRLRSRITIETAPALAPVTSLPAHRTLAALLDDGPTPTRDIAARLVAARAERGDDVEAANAEPATPTAAPF